MEPVYTEIEFEPMEHTTGSLYQALKEIPTIIIYRECIKKHERLAVILLNDRNVPDVKAAAKEHKVKIISRRDVPQSYMLEVAKGKLENQLDGFDTRDARFWLGPWILRSKLEEQSETQ